MPPVELASSQSAGAMAVAWTLCKSQGRSLTRSIAFVSSEPLSWGIKIFYSKLKQDFVLFMLGIRFSSMMHTDS